MFELLFASNLKTKYQYTIYNVTYHMMHASHDTDDEGAWQHQRQQLLGGISSSVLEEASADRQSVSVCVCDSVYTIIFIVIACTQFILYCTI